MKIFCLEEYKVQFEKLQSNKKYKSLEKDVIDYFFGDTKYGKNVDKIQSGTRLNQSIDQPYIKKRISGSGGYRVYFLLLIKKEEAYLMFIHPKTGPSRGDNITDESKAHIYKRALECIKSNDLYLLEVDRENKQIVFKKTE